MKKHIWIVCLLLLFPVLAGCGKPAGAQVLPTPEAPVTASPEPAALPAPEETLELAAPAVSETDAVESPVDADVCEPYAELVEKTAQGLQSGWGDTSPESLGISDVFKRTDDLRLGWLQLDINGDGTDELLFGEITAEGEASPIYDIFCLTGAQLLHPVSGWEFNRWYLLENGQLINEASSTGFDTYRSAYGLFNGALVPGRSSSDGSDYLHLAFADFGGAHE